MNKLQMSWSTTNGNITVSAEVVVADIQTALHVAKTFGLLVFDIAEQNGDAWMPLGSWAIGHDGRWVSIPASEAN